MNTENKTKEKSLITIFREGILDNNPTFVLLLGMCSTLATTTLVSNAVGMGLATTAVLIFSNLFISLLRRFIPDQVRIAAFIVIISGFVCAVELIIKAYLPALDESLGVFIPLIVVNCIILARAEAFASKNRPVASMIDGLASGLGFTCALILIASIRELLGTGKLFGLSLLGSGYKPVLMIIMAPGAFITLGCLVALVQKIRFVIETNARKKMSGKKPEKATGPAGAVEPDGTGENKDFADYPDGKNEGDE